MKILQKYAAHDSMLREQYDSAIDSEVPNLHIYANYINERERMRVRREDQKVKPPWSDDPILPHFRFTNIHREDDKVSRQLAHACTGTKASIVMFNAVMFRTFNCLSGYNAVGGWTEHFDVTKSVKMANDFYSSGGTMFGNAYLMVNSMTAGRPKHQFYIEDLFPLVWNDRRAIVKEIRKVGTLQGAMKVFGRYPGYGEFLAYELALDMEMMGVLREPKDKFTWANPGPGARRGMNLVRGRDVRASQPTKLFIAEMQDLFVRASFFVDKEILSPDRYPFDMRCIENGLCETGKYFSVLQKDQAKRRYYAK